MKMKMKQHSKQQLHFEWVVLFIVLFLSLDIFEVLGTYCFEKIGMSSYVTIVFDIVRILLAFVVLIDTLQSKTKVRRILLVSVLVLILIWISFQINPKLDVMMRTIAVGFVGTWIPSVAIGMALVNKERQLFVYSTKLLPIVYLYIFYMLFNVGLKDVYQNVSYNILFFVLVCLERFFFEKRYDMLFHSVILTAVMVYVGSRGPLLCILLWFFYLLFYCSKMGRDKIIYYFIVGAVLLFIVIFGNSIVEMLREIIPDSRIIKMLYQGRLFEGGRSGIYEYSIKELRERWFSFGGVMADRFYLVDSFLYSDKLGFWLEKRTYDSVYAHNFFLEVFFCFGVIPGMAVCFLLIRKILTLLKQHQGVRRTMLLYLVVSGLIPLMFSNSIWGSTFFWVLLGYLIMINNIKEINMMENKNETGVIKENPRKKYYCRSSRTWVCWIATCSRKGKSRF